MRDTTASQPSIKQDRMSAKSVTAPSQPPLQQLLAMILRARAAYLRNHRR